MRCGQRQSSCPPRRRPRGSPPAGGIHRSGRHRRWRRPDGSGTIQGIVAKHGLMKQSMVVINKSGGAGGEGFLDVKASRAIRTRSSSSRCRTCSPRRSLIGIPFNWKDLTPVAMMALDEFILWVVAEIALQVREGLCRGGEERARQVQDGAPAPSRKIRSSRRRR